MSVADIDAASRLDNVRQLLDLVQPEYEGLYGIATEAFQQGATFGEALSSGGSSPVSQQSPTHSSLCLEVEHDTFWTPNEPSPATVTQSICPVNFGRQEHLGDMASLPAATRPKPSMLTDIRSPGNRRPKIQSPRRRRKVQSPRRSKGVPVGRSLSMAFSNFGEDGDGVKVPEFWNPKASYKSGSSSRSGAPVAKKKSEGSPWMLSPVSPWRLCWDLVALGLLGWEIFATPFELTFLRPDVVPLSFQVLSYVVTAFFVLDILLNLNSGFISGGRVFLERQQSFRHYRRHWLVIDMLAVIPFDKILGHGRSDNLLSGLRILRWLKLFKVAKHAGSWKSWNGQMRSCKWLFDKFVGVLVALAWVHLHACLWSALQQFSKEDVSAALQRYAESFYIVYLGFLAEQKLHVDTPGMKMFVMLIATERVLLWTALCCWAVVQAKVHLSENKKNAKLKADALTYLQYHNIPEEQQIRMLHGLDQAGQASVMQKHFNQFLSQDLPGELRRTIMQELWSNKLMSLHLISSLSGHPGFIVDLAQLCREEVRGCKSIIFKEGEYSSAAYYVIKGGVSMSSKIMHKVPDYGAGMWLGENALVDPYFRRYGTAYTKRGITSLMLLPAESFRELLQTLNLTEELTRWCKDELSEGMCGRCGKMGHWANQCPMSPDSSPSTSCIISRLSSGFTPPPRERAPSLHGEDYSPPVSPLSHRSFSPRSREQEMVSTNLQEPYEHFIFLSHYKLEAGTEAALMHAELENLIQQLDHSAKRCEVPIFLDSENLLNLDQLKRHVEQSHSVALLLTKGVLSRPWCLVEIVTAFRKGIPVLPVKVDKIGTEFSFPDDAFYKALSDGEVLDPRDLELVARCGIDLTELENSIKYVFKHIAVTYSPHSDKKSRLGEVQKLLERCKADTVVSNV